MIFVRLFEFVLLVVAPLVRLVMKMLGIGVVSYVGINLILDQVRAYIIEQTGTLGQAVQMLLGLASFDVAINIYLSAITTKLVLKGLDRASGKLSQIRKNGQGTLEA